jgi:Flp pilus assembly protein TadG
LGAGSKKVRFRTRRRRPQGDERGASAVEFALILPVLLLLVFGIIQYGYYFFAAQNGSSVAREAVRKVAVGDCPDDTVLKSFVETRLSGLSYEDLAVSRSYTPANTIGSRVTVTVSFETLDMNIPFVPIPGEGKVVREVDARVEDLTPESC